MSSFDHFQRKKYLLQQKNVCLEWMQLHLSWIDIPETSSLQRAHGHGYGSTECPAMLPTFCPRGTDWAAIPLRGRHVLLPLSRTRTCVFNADHRSSESYSLLYILHVFPIRDKQQHSVFVNPLPREFGRILTGSNELLEAISTYIYPSIYLLDKLAWKYEISVW